MPESEGRIESTTPKMATVERLSRAHPVGTRSFSTHEIARTPPSKWELPLLQSATSPTAASMSATRFVTKQSALGKCTYATWNDRLRVLRETRADLAQDLSMQHLAPGLDACIEAIVRMTGAMVTRESPRRLNNYDISPHNDGVTDRSGEAPDTWPACVTEKTPVRSPHCATVVPSIPLEEQVLPGSQNYNVESLTESFERMDVSKNEEEDDEIPPALALEASATETHFSAELVRKLYSRRWMRRVDAVDEIVALLESGAILAINDESIPRAVAGVSRVLARMFQDHALKVLIKSLELLDAFFVFMERNACCASTSVRCDTARGDTSRGSAASGTLPRGNAVNYGTAFLEVIVARLGDRVSAVVNCAVCALLKVAESSTIPTYEDVVNCVVRSLGAYNAQPGVRSICNRLRLISTLLLRAHLYNSHGLARLAVRQAAFFDVIGALCRHSHGAVRTMALETLAVGLKLHFSGAAPKLDAALRDAAERIQPQSASVYAGDAGERTRGLLAEAQATWPADVLRARTARH
ncbi:GntR family transcriptional regulator [Babesia caballi]|uniref:GntR family transcriptional regulator n=1 Tax=Babesia caballi TaxID=5871 RepID=A0AAV4LW54_BABCB|nr:GntR family transcriptional regulator [Babesia caballi]